MAPIHIIISGASSVGKSTLVNQCLKEFREDKKLNSYRFKHIEEVARNVFHRLKKTGQDLQDYIEQGDLSISSSMQLSLQDRFLPDINSSNYMNTIIKVPTGPTDLSYYTTWWLSSTPSTSSSNPVSSSADDDLLTKKTQKKQKMVKNRLMFTCCIPKKIFRIK